MTRSAHSSIAGVLLSQLYAPALLPKAELQEIAAVVREDLSRLERQFYRTHGAETVLTARQRGDGRSDIYLMEIDDYGSSRQQRFLLERRTGAALYSSADDRLAAGLRLHGRFMDDLERQHPHIVPYELSAMADALLEEKMARDRRLFEADIVTDESEFEYAVRFSNPRVQDGRAEFCFSISAADLRLVLNLRTLSFVNFSSPAFPDVPVNSFTVELLARAARDLLEWGSGMC